MHGRLLISLKDSWNGCQRSFCAGDNPSFIDNVRLQELSSALYVGVSDVNPGEFRGGDQIMSGASKINGKTPIAYRK